MISKCAGLALLALARAQDALPPCAPGALLSVALNESTGAHGVCVDGALWLGPAFTTAAARLADGLFATRPAGAPGGAGATLAQAKPAARSQGVDEWLGPYDETRFFWRYVGGPVFETAVRAHADGATLSFVQAFPDALALGGALDARDDVTTSWPTFGLDAAPGAPTLNFVTFGGNQLCGARTGRWGERAPANASERHCAVGTCVSGRAPPRRGESG